jgi:hypothetical protein
MSYSKTSTRTVLFHVPQKTSKLTNLEVLKYNGISKRMVSTENIAYLQQINFHPQVLPCMFKNRIVLRAHRLVGQPDHLVPLAIYQCFPGSQRPSYFTKASVTRAFKTLAMSYYGLPKGDRCLKYTPHSLQEVVGACAVILHTHGLTE